MNIICNQDSVRTFCELFPIPKIAASGERDLWSAVMQDAVEGCREGKEKSLLFVEATGGMFDQICEWLSLDKDCVRTKILQR